jgi:hypothetical protein
MKIKATFQFDVSEKILKEAKQIGWTKKQIKEFVQNALDGWVQDSVYESINTAIQDEKDITEYKEEGAHNNE